MLAVPIALLTVFREMHHPLAAAGGVLLLATTTLIPSAYIWREYRGGEVRTLELITRAERRRPTTFAALCAVAAAGAFMVFDMPQALRFLSWAIAIQLVLMAGITPFWKISYHAATAGMLAAAISQFGNPTITAVALGVALSIGWSRIHLGRHTPAQVAAGFALSAPTWIALNV